MREVTSVVAGRPSRDVVDVCAAGGNGDTDQAPPEMPKVRYRKKAKTQTQASG